MLAGKISRNAFDIRLLKAERNLDNIIQLSDDFAYWDGQDQSGAVALATNSALTVPDTRNVAGLTIADYTLNANWANPSGQIARHTAGSTATLQQDDILAPGKTYQVTITLANRTAGSITITDGGAAISANEETIRTITSTGTDFIVTPTNGFDGDIDVAILLVQQTDIAASSAYPGAEELDNPGNPFTFTGGILDNWIIAAVGDATSNILENPSGHVQFISDGTPTNMSQIKLTIGKRYKYRVIVSGFVSGSANIVISNPGFETIRFMTAIGEFTSEFVATGETFLINRTIGQTTNITFQSISVTEVNPMIGDYTGVSLGQPGNRQVRVMVAYGGAADYADVDSAEFNSILDPTEFALSIIVQKDTWDAAERYFFSHTVDSDNWIRCGGTSTIGQLLWEVRAGGTTEQILLASGSPTDIFHMGIQVKSGVMSAIYRGEIIATEAVAGTFVGNFDTMIIGAKNDTPNNVHLGKLAYHVHSKDKSAGQWLREAKAAGAI